MKDTDKQLQFVELRAKGESFSKIAEELHIAKSTAIEWAGKYEAAISDLQRERLEELYTLYGMAKEARIARMGGMLQRINEALESKDLSELPADKLLQMKLQYERALKEEYSAATPQLTDCSEEEILTATAAVFRSTQSGEVSAAAAKIQLEGLKAAAAAKTAYDNRDPWNFV